MAQRHINLGPEYDKSHWPKNVRTIGIDRLDLLGVDENNHLYWNGKQVEVARRVTLTRWQATGAFIVGIFAIVGAIGSFGQGWTAYNNWACHVHWPAVVCPISK